MANLVAEWILLLGTDISEVQEIIEQHLKNIIKKNFDMKKADSIFSDAGEDSSLRRGRRRNEQGWEVAVWEKISYQEIYALNSVFQRAKPSLALSDFLLRVPHGSTPTTAVHGIFIFLQMTLYLIPPSSHSVNTIKMIEYFHPDEIRRSLACSEIS